MDVVKIDHRVHIIAVELMGSLEAEIIGIEIVLRIIFTIRAARQAARHHVGEGGKGQIQTGPDSEKHISKIKLKNKITDLYYFLLLFFSNDHRGFRFYNAIRL